jgi:hypothetical protein
MPEWNSVTSELVPTKCQAWQCEGREFVEETHSFGHSLRALWAETKVGGADFTIGPKPRATNCRLDALTV